MTNGLFIANGLITVKDEASHTFPIAITNVIYSNTNLSAGRIFSAVETIKIKDYYVICDGFDKEFQDKVSIFLK